jgi:hypothetical protein
MCTARFIIKGEYEISGCDSCAIEHLDLLVSEDVLLG